MSNILHLRLFPIAIAILGRASIKSDDNFFITEDEFQALDYLGLIVPVDKGGFIKAPPHSEGGVKLLWPDNDKYLVWAELEGYEFIMTPNITKIAENELLQLNEKFLSENPDSFLPYEIPSNVTIIDGSNTQINGFEFPRFLVSCGRPQFIVNKFSTMAAFDILEELNRGSLKQPAT